MQHRIFYSWQSDLPGACNRSLIESALLEAAKALRADGSLTIEPVIDRDTSGVGGAPQIADTIFSKIEECQVFVADVSIINATSKKRKTPNPNVLVELGYAMKVVGATRIVLVMNTAFGTPEQLPFDLRMRRVVPYSSKPEDTERAPQRKELASRFYGQLKLMRKCGGDGLIAH